MRYIFLIVILFLAGCYRECYIHSDYTRSGYPTYHKPDNICRPWVCQRHNIIDGSCVCQCRHSKAPLFNQVYEPPIYKPVFSGVDCQGNEIYQNQLIRGGFYKEAFIGYYCTLCGRRL